jgi:two-component system, OmpR family, phosphate regulon sensor histidine kinase PhoR
MAGGQKPLRVLRSAVLIGAVPALSLLALMLAGELAPAPAALALLCCAAAAGTIAWLWIGDLARLSEALRLATQAEGQIDPRAADSLLPGIAEIGSGVSRLARSLAARHAELGQLRRADEAIVERLPDPLLVLAPDGTPLRANAAARALFGGEGEGLGGGAVAALLRHPLLAEAVERALAGGGAETVDLAIPVPVPRELAARAIAMDPPLADGGRVMVVLADRTRERAVERMRHDFVANASHELRTPLASLIGFIETLRGPAEADTKARRRFLGIMAEQAGRMQRLIDDLLGLSRIELTEHLPPTGTAPLAELIRAELAGLEPLLAARHVRVETALEETACASPADADQLAQVVRNLLANAIRHGREAGLVRLTLAIAPRGGRSGVTLEVADDGPGIPKADLPRLTERFYRVDKGRARQTGGTGLGLAIVKHIVNRHRGILGIDSTLGEGTQVHIWLPGGAFPAPATLILPQSAAKLSPR